MRRTRRANVPASLAIVRHRDGQVREWAAVAAEGDVVVSVNDVNFAIAAGNALKFIMSIAKDSFDLGAETSCRRRKVSFVDAEGHRQRQAIEVEDCFVHNSIGGCHSVDNESSISPSAVQTDG